MPPPLPLAFPDELTEEILLRLPPDEPACLLRASLVCWAWRRHVSHPGFLRRLHALHRRAPLLGFFHNHRPPLFIHTTKSPFSLTVPDQRAWWTWRILDCRHGRVLLLGNGYVTGELLVWEPITGLQRWMRPPSGLKDGGSSNAAVVCAADGCDHSGCHGGPFRVVFVSSDESVISARVYSSETRAWGEPASLGHACSISRKPGTIVRNSLQVYFLCSNTIVEYDLVRHGLAVVDLPDHPRNVLMRAEDGGLGIARVEGSSLCLWSRDLGAHGDGAWVQRRAIDLDALLPDVALTASRMRNLVGFAEDEDAIFLCTIVASRIGHVIGFVEDPHPIFQRTIAASRIGHVIGFVEGANAILLSTIAGIFAVDLESERAKKVYDTENFDIHACRNLIPFSSFYIPGNESAPKEEREEEPVSTLLHL